MKPLRHALADLVALALITAALPASLLVLLLVAAASGVLKAGG